ncbi:MAG: choice-of-anchor D domain-containing protein [Planctomycetota bacterium]|nr:MAG: choice-of-anchor D domain-containing protein [Planctomycetota bacterium]
MGDEECRAATPAGPQGAAGQGRGAVRARVRRDRAKAAPRGAPPRTRAGGTARDLVLRRSAQHPRGRTEFARSDPGALTPVAFRTPGSGGGAGPDAGRYAPGRERAGPFPRPVGNRQLATFTLHRLFPRMAVGEGGGGVAGGVVVCHTAVTASTKPRPARRSVSRRTGTARRRLEGGPAQREEFAMTNGEPRCSSAWWWSVALICAVAWTAAGRADEVVQNGPISDPATWGGALPDNVANGPGDHLYVRNHLFLYVADHDGTADYDQLDLRIGDDDTGGTLRVAGGTLRVANLQVGGSGAGWSSAQVEIRNGVVDVVGDVLTAPGSGARAQLTVQEYGALHVGGRFEAGAGTTTVSVAGAGRLVLGALPSPSTATAYFSIVLSEAAVLVVPGDHSQDPSLGGIVHSNTGVALSGTFDGTSTTIGLGLSSYPGGSVMRFPPRPYLVQDRVPLHLVNTLGTDVTVDALELTAARGTTSPMGLSVSLPSGVSLPATLSSGQRWVIDVKADYGSVSGQLHLLAHTDGGLTFDRTITISGYRPVSNGVYEVYHADGSYGAAGTYTIRTGPDHPYTIAHLSRADVLYGTGNPWSSVDTIRSYNSGTDYVMTTVSYFDSDFTVQPVGGQAVVTPVDDGSELGFDVVVRIGDAAGNETPAAITDRFTITRRIRIRGGSFSDSHVDITTSVHNESTDLLRLGIRYQWDYQIISDDGPTFEAMRPDGPVLFVEKSFVPPSINFYGIADRDEPGDTPSFYVFGTVLGPALQPQPPTPPEELHFVSWPDVYDTAFTYVPTGQDVANYDEDIDDSAVTYVWGATEDSAHVVAPGDTWTVSQSLFAAPVDATTGEAQLPGDVVGAPEIDVQPRELNFGLQIEGDRDRRPVEIRNVGSGTLTVLGIDFGDPQFSADARFPLRIDEGQAVTVDVVFRPTVAAPVSTTATVISDTVGSVTVALHVIGDVRGTSTASQLEIEPWPIDFGTVPAGGSRERLVTVRNPGSAPLLVTQALLPDRRFQIVDTNLPWTVPPGGSVQVRVRFTPQQVGDAETYLSVSSNSASARHVSVPVLGSANTEKLVQGSGCQLATDPAAGPGMLLLFSVLAGALALVRVRRWREA